MQVSLGGFTQLVMSNNMYASTFSCAVNVVLHSSGKSQLVVFWPLLVQASVSPSLTSPPAPIVVCS